MVDVTDATFENDVMQASLTAAIVVDLWAPWCGPCKTLGPILEKVIDETKGQVVLAKVNVDENPAISRAFQVQSIPAVFALKDGRIVDGFVGAQPEAAVREFVDRLLPTDVESFTTATPEDEAQRMQRVRRLETVLSQLSPKARATFIWARRDGQTYEEIGKQLGVSRNMVKKYLQQAIAHCRKSLDREEGG